MDDRQYYAWTQHVFIKHIMFLFCNVKNNTIENPNIF